MIAGLIILASLIAFYFLVSALIANGMAMSHRVPVTKTPSQFGLAYRDVSFYSRNDNTLIKGWYIPGGDNGTIIAMHGGKQCRNDETMDLLKLCCELAKKGFNVLTIDRRGCGLSRTGNIRSRSHFDLDFGGAFDYILNQKEERERIFLLGVSTGAVAAIIFASRQNGISGVVSDSCFASNYRMGSRVMDQKFPIFSIFTPGSILMGYLLTGLRKDNAIDRISQVKCPILFVNGRSDKAVPPDDTILLFKASANRHDDLWIVDGADHSQAYRTRPKDYVDKVAAFLSLN
jgi:alpha-beta hydrolase superfamily lysophospholipase